MKTENKKLREKSRSREGNTGKETEKEESPRHSSQTHLIIFTSGEEMARKGPLPRWWILGEFQADEAITHMPQLQPPSPLSQAVPWISKGSLLHTCTFKFLDHQLRDSHSLQAKSQRKWILNLHCTQYITPSSWPWGGSQGECEARPCAFQPQPWGFWHWHTQEAGETRRDVPDSSHPY